MFCCMTLRRFPWKAPRLSDNSYKLFVTPPDETDDSRRFSSAQSKSEPVSRTGSGGTESTSTGHHHHHHHGEAKSDPPTNANGQNGSAAPAPSKSPAPSTQISTNQQQQIIKGPWRLLRLLPRESRHIVGRMLEVDPRKRATLDEILADKWVVDSPACRQEDGKVIRAGSHEHTLEPGSGPTPTPSKK